MFEQSKVHLDSDPCENNDDKETLGEEEEEVRSIQMCRRMSIHDVSSSVRSKWWCSSPMTEA